MGKWKHFKDEEVQGLSDELVERLDRAREVCGFPFVITSGFRPPEKNDQVGGVKDSEHTKGLAVDLRTPADRFLRDKMVFALGAVGFRRMGSYSRHLHLDISTEKPNACWDGGESH